jgi:uncharacterized membrane protein
VARGSETAAHYEARWEAAPVLLIATAVLVALALVSYRRGWELHGLPWWIWLVLALPTLLASLDLALGARGAGIVRTRAAALVLLGVVIAGNLLGLALLVAALVSTSTGELGGGQLLTTAVAIWMTDVCVFGLWFWELDDGGPFARARHERARPDFQFPQDENSGLARPGWRPRVWDYLYTSLANASAFSATDVMPLTLHAKLVMGLEAVISLALVVLVTARAVNVLGS